MGRKRNRLHLDRGEVLDHKGKKPNISPSVETSLVSGKMGSYERHFTHKLFVPQNDYLDAYILHNEICVLFTKDPIDATSIRFDVVVEVMSGRRKKGARRIKAETIICELTTADNQTIALRTPVGGQLLELNENLQQNLDILRNTSSGERYVAIIFPDTKIPSPGQSVEEWRIIQASIASRSNLCYSWIQGKCSRGDKCKFLHSNPESESKVEEGEIEVGGGEGMKVVEEVEVELGVR